MSSGGRRNPARACCSTTCSPTPMTSRGDVEPPTTFSSYCTSSPWASPPPRDGGGPPPVENTESLHRLPGDLQYDGSAGWASVRLTAESLPSRAPKAGPRSEGARTRNRSLQAAGWSRHPGRRQVPGRLWARATGVAPGPPGPPAGTETEIVASDPDQVISRRRLRYSIGRPAEDHRKPAHQRVPPASGGSDPAPLPRRGQPY